MPARRTSGGSALRDAMIADAQHHIQTAEKLRSMGRPGPDDFETRARARLKALENGKPVQVSADELADALYDAELPRRVDRYSGVEYVVQGDGRYEVSSVTHRD